MYFSVIYTELLLKHFKELQYIISKCNVALFFLVISLSKQISNATLLSLLLQMHPLAYLF